MSAAGSIERLATALDATGAVITAVGEDQWSNPTACPDWNVRGIVNHLVVGSRLFAAALRGEPLAPGEVQRLRGSDQLGTDPVGAHRAAGAALLAAFADPTVSERVFDIPIGSAPGAVLLHLRITEELVHGWDLVEATAQPTHLPDDIAEEELAFARSQLDVRVPRRGRFGDAQPIADGALAIERLAAFLGRTVPPSTVSGRA